MRFLPTVSLLALSFAAQADTVRGHCEDKDVRLDFTDGIAFQVAKSDDGTVTTSIYLTVEKLDRAKLSCPDCGDPLPVMSAMSSRGYTVQQQTQKGWSEIVHVGGEQNTTMIVDITYLDATGTLTGIVSGDAKVTFEHFSDTRVAGRIADQPGSYPEPDDTTCDVSFDLGVGWPSKP